MGNNPSKPEGKTTSSPVASHTSAASPNHSRQEPRATVVTKNSSAQPSSQPPAHVQQNNSHAHSYSQSHSHARSHSIPYSANSPSQRHPHLDDRMGNEQSRQKWREKKEQSTPVRVPRGADPRRQRGPDSQFESSGPPPDPSFIPHSNLGFPPRVPLPIEEEVYTPGSPILTPAGFASVLHDDDDDNDDVEILLPRQASGVSSTVDEDDISDELQQFSLDDSKGTVPTVVTWSQGGDRVYVTGTFTAWNKKFRMNKNPGTDILSTVLQLPPGTHHVKFIVDGDMQLSNELPTAVDYTNILVNYIEVSADDIPREKKTKEYKVPEGIFPPLVLPEDIEAHDHAPDSVGNTRPVEPEQASEPVFWGEEVPEYLADLDLPEHSRRYQRAARGVAKDFPPPPSLPLFLGKSILNGTTPMKDDSSVLTMPNHTVLNHLATSSIKHQVLATSVTTRYKRKYVTTIMYKPTVDGGD